MSLAVSHEVKHTLSCDLAIPLLDLPKRSENACSKVCILMFIVTMRSIMEEKNHNKLHTNFRINKIW